ncbi:MAG: 50S ribosomal protein L19 [Candidatus Pacebacteria bacterium]|jgi:large subunit ribosomal protein L19|nr:50S ribosomal protein L19 [Candidatus Paceibacterota bacterium]
MTKTAMKLTPVEMDARKNLGFRSGDTVRVWSKILEKGKTRLQAFEGLVLSRKHGTTGTNAMFTIRKVSNAVGVERIFPLYSPNIDKIEIVKKSKARRSKLYYIRTKATKDIRRKIKKASFDTGEPKEKIETEA